MHSAFHAMEKACELELPHVILFAHHLVDIPTHSDFPPPFFSGMFR
jgi:hypothetical protein